MLTVYGIKNCDTVRKARKFLDTQGIAYQFHDFRAEGLSKSVLARWLRVVCADTLLNRRGTTWRNLPDGDKAKTSTAALQALMLANPTLIKRPVCERATRITVGWSKDIESIWR